MKRMKSIGLKKGFLLQTIYQLVIMILPIFMAPIVTRALGSEALGIFVYVNSISYYFIIFANLGIAKHGQRAIASAKDDRNRLSETFWSLLFVHIVFSFASALIYCVFVLLFISNNQLIYWIFLFAIIAALFDLTWLFYGLENFTVVIISNLVTRIVAFVCIVLFVKTSADLWIYTIIEIGSTLIANLIVLAFALKQIPFRRISLNDCLSHVKPMFFLFLSIVASTLYTVFDKTLLGILSSKNDVAFYEYSNKIIAIPNAFIGVVSTILFPRACYYANNGDSLSRDSLAKNAYVFISFIGIGAIFGLFGVGNLLAKEYYGPEFSICGEIMCAISPLILIIGIGDVFRNIYLIPMKKDVFFVVCSFANAIINILISLLLIPVVGIYGAVIGTICAEVFGLVLQGFYCRKHVKFKQVLKPVFLFFLSGFLMYKTIKIISSFLNNDIVGLVIQIGVGLAIYLFISLIIIASFYKEIWLGFLNIILRRKKT